MGLVLMEVKHFWSKKMKQVYINKQKESFEKYIGIHHYHLDNGHKLLLEPTFKVMCNNEK